MLIVLSCLAISWDTICLRLAMQLLQHAWSFSFITAHHQA
jgi:hypothetical protein